MVHSKTPPGVPRPKKERQAWFMKAENIKGKHFTMEHVWTFTFRQRRVNLMTYELRLWKLPLWIDLTDCLNGQPLQFTMKDRYCSTVQV